MKRNILLSYIFSITYYFYADLALWVIYLTDKKGLPVVALGILQLIQTITRIIFDVPSGILCDKIGRVKTLIISTLIGMFADVFLIFGHSFFTISLAYISFGISIAFMSGTLEAFMYDSLAKLGKEDSYKKVATNQYIYIMISFVVAMILGAYLSLYDMRLMYVSNLIAEVFALIACFFMIEPPTLGKHFNSISKIIKNSSAVIKNNRFLVYLIMFITITDAVSNNTWHLSQKLFSQIGFSYKDVTTEAIFTTIAAGMAAKLGYYADKKFGLLGSSLLTSIFLAFPLIILGAFKNVYFMLPAITLTTMTISFARPTYDSYINHELKSSYRATVLSMESFLTSIFATAYVLILSITNDISKTFLIGGILAIPIYSIILGKLRKSKII